MVSVINEVAYMSDYFLPGIQEARLLTGLQKPEEIAQHYLTHGTGTIVIKWDRLVHSMLQRNVQEP